MVVTFSILRDKIEIIDECWLWRGHIHTEQGYGRLKIKGKNYAAHRLVWEALIGPLPATDDLHHCRESCPRHCVNPEHLMQMSHGEHRGLHNRLPGRNYLKRLELSPTEL